MLKVTEMNMIILVDGFISTAVLLAAYSMNPAIVKNAFFSHRSDEAGHQLMLEHLGGDTILDLQMRLGEGTGCALAYPMVEAAVNFLNEMASFESASVSNKEG